MMISWHEEEDYNTFEDKRNGKAQKADIHQNHKRHILPVSLCKLLHLATSSVTVDSEGRLAYNAKGWVLMISISSHL